QIVKVPSQPKARASPLECLRLRRRSGVLIVSPLLTQAAVRSKAVDCQPAGHDNLSRNGALTIPSVLTFEVLDDLHRVLARPTAYGEERVQPICVRARIGISNHLTAASVRGRIRDPPFDLIRLEGVFEGRLKLANLFIGVLLCNWCVLQCGSR